MKTPGQVPRLRFYPTAPIQDLPVQVIQIHLAIFPQLSTCMFRAPPVLSKFTFSMLSFCIAVSRKTLCITDLNKTTLHRPHSLLPWGLQFTTFQTGEGLLCHSPMACRSLYSGNWVAALCTEQGPGPFATKANCRSLHSYLPFPSSPPLQGLSLWLLLFTGGSHQGKAAWHPLTENIF